MCLSSKCEDKGRACTLETAYVTAKCFPRLTVLRQPILAAKWVIDLAMKQRGVAQCRSEADGKCRCIAYEPAHSIKPMVDSRIINKIITLIVLFFSKIHGFLIKSFASITTLAG